MNRRRYDLHSHTHFSDGTVSPEALVAEARAAGVDVLALTDHDTTEAIDLAAAAAQAAGIQLVPGVEISSTWQGRTIHIVGLNVDLLHLPLQQGLAWLREIRLERAEVIDRRLQKAGIPDCYAAVRALAQGSIISRTHFARHLVQAGHARDMGQAFKRFLSSGGKGHAPTQWATLEQAVAWVRGAGGQSVIAHPARYKLGTGKLTALFENFREAGGDAVEVHSGSQRPEESQRIARLVNQLGLKASVGSDYHGPEQHWIGLGRLPALPEDCVPVWVDWDH